MACCRCHLSDTPLTWLDGLGLVCAPCRLALAPQVDAAGVWRPREAPEANGHHRTYQMRGEEDPP